mgnify:FL=1
MSPWLDDEKKKLAKKKREEDKEKQTETYDQTISRLTKEPYRYQMNDEEKETEKMFKDLGKNTLETNTENKPMASGTGSPCKGICIDFKTKKPSTGGRYEFGQARCQTCEIWTDYRGAKLKSGEPAPEGSLGWYCVCCNIRLRQKPRGKEYKDRLTKVLDDSNTPHGIEINNWIEDSMILIKSRKNGILQSEIQKILSISNKDMRELVPRITRIENIVINDVDDPNSQSYSVEKKFKFVVTKYDITASQIAKFVESRELSNPQPYTSVLEKFRKFSEGFKDESFEDILSRFIIGKSENSSKNQKSIINNFIKYTFEQTPESITVEKKESDRDKKKESDRDKKKESDRDKKIKIMVQVMIKEYIRDKYSRNKQLKQRLTIEFVKGASISEICKSNPEYSKNEILNHIITDKRLPAELKEMENEQYFDSDKEISLAIPLFAVDYYQWEGAKKDEQKVIDLAVAIKKHLGKKNNKTRDIFYTQSTRSKLSFQKSAKNRSVQGMRLERIIKLILFKMYDQAYNMCVEELEILLDNDIIFCKIYCLIKLSKTKDAKINAIDYMEKSSKRKRSTSSLITKQCIIDETGEKVNQIFYDIEKRSITK